MSNVIDIKEYRIKKRENSEAEKTKKRRDMVLAMDTLIREAYRIGVCPTCGGLGGRHGTYCKENPNHPFKKHENHNKNSNIRLLRTEEM